MSFGLPGLFLSIVCAVHVVRSGRDTLWLWIVLLIPGLGALVYLLTQVLPDLFRGNAARTMKRKVRTAMDPERARRDIQAQLAVADTLENRLRLARESMRLKDPAMAVEMYRSCLKGIHATDADILLELATAQFETDDFAGTRKTLEELMAANPGFRSPSGHLLYARSLEALGETDRALEEYATLDESFPGEEARVRHARLLVKGGRPADARKIFEQVVVRAQAAPGFYRNREKAWIDEARSGVARLPAA